ncbi:MAG: efflux RND transporter periplasmic adaptor subunit [Candidatus Promineofilum sp.]|nr:efflux RND transporter periplasmic adaptor subunit [Promineifilum sp.]
MRRSRFLITFLAALALTACGQAAEPPAAASPAARAALSGDITAEGMLVPLETADLAFPGGGIVVELAAVEGATVAAGDPLVRLDDAAPAAALAQAEAGVASAEAARAAAEAGVQVAAAQGGTAEAALAAAEAQLGLVEAGARPEELLAAERALAAAEAGVAVAAADRDAATDVSRARVGAAEAQVAAALSQLTALQQTYDTILTTCVTLPNGDEVCPLLGAPEESARAQVEAAEAGYAAAQTALAEAQAGASAGERGAADAAVAVAVAQRDVAAAQLALLRVGARPEQIELAAIGVEQAKLGVEQAAVAARAAAATLAQAEAGISAAQAAVDAARASQQRLTLVAPFAGTVAEINAEVGEQVAPGAAVVRLGSAGRWAVETSDLVELDVAGVSVGQTVGVTLDALPGETLRGTVIDVGRVPELARGDVVYRVRVALDDYPDLPLRWGMTAVATMDRP